MIASLPLLVCSHHPQAEVLSHDPHISFPRLGIIVLEEGGFGTSGAALTYKYIAI